MTKFVSKENLAYYHNKTKPILLWRNGLPEDEMNSTNANLSKSLEIGKRYRIVWTFGLAWEKMITEFIYIGSNESVHISYSRPTGTDKHLNIASRQLKFNGDSVYISDCYYYDGTFSGFVLNTICVPKEIYELPV